MFLSSLAAMLCFGSSPKQILTYFISEECIFQTFGLLKDPSMSRRNQNVAAEEMPWIMHLKLESSMLYCLILLLPCAIISSDNVFFYWWYYIDSMIVMFSLKCINKVLPKYYSRNLDTFFQCCFYLIDICVLLKAYLLTLGKYLTQLKDTYTSHTSFK